MDWKSTFDGVVGAIVGGSLTGIAAYVGLGRAVMKLSTTIDMMRQTCQRCTEHIECDEKHISSDMRERMERMETRIDGHLNGARAGAK